MDGYSQTLNVTSRTSGFVPGAPFVRHFRLGDYDLYAQDKWRVSPRLTLTLGLRYQLPGVLDERDSLELLPVLQGSAVQTLLSNATLNFAGSSVGRPYYNRPKKDFAPNVGFAWDVFGDGKTALRGGYSISYVNDQEILAPENMLEANGGLQGFTADTGLSDRVSTGLPKILPPTYQVPLKVSDNYALDPFNVVTLVDPNLNRPHVQQYSIGIQHDFKGTLVEARYVGNHVVGAYRAFDFNQVEIKSNGFLAGFPARPEQRLSRAGRQRRLQPGLQPEPAGQPAADGFSAARPDGAADGVPGQPDRDRRARRARDPASDERLERQRSTSSRIRTRSRPTC